MSAMAIPPFPPLDLAKLVLGYLAEEQLMTAYDEFLQASPYLDALRNEYDRIFMTSLKNVLAEYRAVKIYVETCKPFALRRKLFQCTNLLDVVKFLVNHIDLNKIQLQDTNSFRNSSDKFNSSSKLNTCEICESSKLTSCACKTRQAVSQVSATSAHSTSNCELADRESSVEATALSDLPGNHVPPRKKLVKTLDKESSFLHSSASGSQDSTLKQSTSSFSNAAEDQNSVLSRHDNMLQNISVQPKVTDESQEKIKEFNDILHLVCTRNTSNMQQGNVDRRVSNAGTFQDFATGMIGDDKRNVNVPDCSNVENVNLQVPNAKDKKLSTKKSRRSKKSQIVVVANLVENLKQPNEVIDVDAIDDKDAPQVQPKVDQSKIKILSDVKVGNETLNNNLNAVLQNATSTPMLKMQTVVINGTPVYKPVNSFTHQNYTKDEIMAMPTIIVTPLTGPSQPQPQEDPAPLHQAPTVPPPVEDHMSTFIPLTNSASARSLGPLLIEVSSNNTYTFKQAVPMVANSAEPNHVDQGLITTVSSANLVNTVSSANLVNTVTDTGKSTDAVSASVPKDNVIATGTETSTPQVLPPTRKSSSTPRRSSHVRVLDFTTPRRILHETINEVPNSNIAEVILSKSPNVVIPNVNVENDTANVDAKDSDSQKQTSKENNNTNVQTKKKDWDSDLRAHLGGCASNQIKSKPKTRKKKVLAEPKRDDNEDDKSSKKKSKPRKSKKDKSQVCPDCENKDEDASVQTNQKVDIPKKPTINIISGHDWEVSHQETEKTLNKSTNDEQDTPELDRLCLEKAIGARLNISDLLETPYKQALYDIQMETPRFLGPDLPGDPPSDIKITNIPTPRFLTSPRGVQATPSYSSRPTDYSSGGSYYKPDDQDYMPLPEQIGYPASSSQEIIKPPGGVNDEEQENENKIKYSRPVRQCAKNVNYFRNQMNKTKEDGTKKVINSVKENSISDSSFDQSSLEKRKSKDNSLKNTPRISTKSDKGRKSISKKYKSPLKKEVSKSFMKIRPMRSTPIKESKGERSKKRALKVPTSKSQSKRRTTSKDRNTHVTPATVAVPTKSRRKSSTPRKLHCAKIFNSESSGHNSPDLVNKDKHNDLSQEAELQSVHDSDTEQLKLRWSDDGSQDAKPKPSQDNVVNDSEDISKIQEYIKTTICSKSLESEGSLHIDLIKRGFDIETAKIIERDLLDTPPHPKADNFVPQILQSESKLEETVLEKTIESESSISNNLQIIQDEQQDEDDEFEEIELSVHECDKDSDNYFTYVYDDNMDNNKAEHVKLKEKFCMEVCIDDGVTIRLRATQCSTLFNLSLDDEKCHDHQDIDETQRAVSSIKFQTPLKDRIKAQCFEIFDSTLTSLDTPLKAVDTPRRPDPEVTVTEIVLEVENVDMKDKTDCKKRKRVHSGNLSDDSGGESKKSKSEPQYMLDSANIQNIDMESVLSKLHGP